MRRPAAGTAAAAKRDVRPRGRWPLPATLLPGVLALCVLILAACGTDDARELDDDSVPEEARYGGTAVIGGMGEIPTLNPLASTDYVAVQFQRFALFTPLLQYGPDLRPRPWLAESWELSDDSTEVVFHLRDDVRWHDGEEVTAYDLAFTFRRAKDPDVAYPNAGYFTRWDSVEVVDRRTARFHVRPHPEPLFGWAVLPVLPEHVLGEVPPEELGTHPFGVDRPVGSGPFRFVERRAGDRWVFEANPDFPEELGGRPYLDRLVYRVIPDETTLLTELRRGQVDFYMQVLPIQLRRLQEASGVSVVTFPFASYEFIGWNMRRPQFSDARVRRALTMAIDRERIIEAARGGLGEPATGPVGPWHWAYDTARRPLPFDPDSARTLLERAGWRDVDGDGVREKDGVRLSFELVTNENRVRQDIMVMVQAQLADVGVEVRPRTREYASLVDALTRPERAFDAVVLAWNPDPVVVDERDLWSCDRRDGPFHLSGYCDRELDAVLDSLTLPLDRETRGGLLRRYSEHVYRDQPYTFLYYTVRANGLREELRGVEMDVRGELISVDRWWIHPEGR